MIVKATDTCVFSVLLGTSHDRSEAEFQDHASYTCSSQHDEAALKRHRIQVLAFSIPELAHEPQPLP